MNTTDTSEEYVSSIADLHLTKDGKQGEILKVMERGGWPILIAHWQSLFANGLGTGLRVLAEVDPGILDTLIVNFALNASMEGWQRQIEARDLLHQCGFFIHGVSSSFALPGRSYICRTPSS